MAALARSTVDEHRSGMNGEAEVSSVAPPGVSAPLTFDAFYAAQYGRLLRVVYALSGSRATAEDLAQDALIRAYRAWDEVARMERPDAWVCTVAVNLARSRLRRLAAEARATLRLRSRSGTRPTVLAEDTERFWAAVRRLPQRQAVAVTLHYGDDLAVADVANVMGCAEGTVKSHLHDARARLADWYADQEEVER